MFWPLVTVAGHKGASVRGQYSTMVSILASGPSCPRFDSRHIQNFSGEIFFNVAEANQQRWFAESGQCLKNVDQTHLVLASSKPVLQKVPL